MAISSPLIETLIWDETSQLPSAVISKSGLEFALYDSAYTSRLPIVISSEITPSLLGAEYVYWRPTENVLEKIIGRITSLIGGVTLETITLKSPPLRPSETETVKLSSTEKDKSPGGQLLFMFRAEKWKVDVPGIQESLNVHAQDIHNFYANRRWGELLMSMSRIIKRCIE
jgi:hypothetical protein